MTWVSFKSSTKRHSQKEGNAPSEFARSSAPDPSDPTNPLWLGLVKRSDVPEASLVKEFKVLFLGTQCLWGSLLSLQLSLQITRM